MTYTQDRSNAVAQIPARQIPVCTLEVKWANSWELSIGGLLIGNICRVPRWVVDNDDIDRDAEYAYQIRCEVDGGELWEAATVKEAVGDLFAHWFSLSGQVPDEPERTAIDGYDPM
jgi:hypothetical protein